MNYQKMRIDFTQKRGLTAPFVYKTGEIDVDGIEAELVNIDVDGSPIGFIKLISPTGIERESALRIENGFAYFDIPKNEEGLCTVELTILNKKNKTRSGNIAIEVINSLSYDSEEYETLLDTITKNDAEYTSNENIRIENESTRVSNESERIIEFDGIKTDFENLTVGKQLDSEVIIARNGKASLKDNIESKRDKSVLLTQSDLSTSSEAHKITPNHLNQAVKDMIVGTTPVSPNISDGQVSIEKISGFKTTNLAKHAEVLLNTYINPSTLTIGTVSGAKTLKIPVLEKRVYSLKIVGVTLQDFGFYYGFIFRMRDGSYRFFKKFTQVNKFGFTTIVTPPNCEFIEYSVVRGGIHTLEVETCLTEGENDCSEFLTSLFNEKIIDEATAKKIDNIVKLEAVFENHAEKAIVLNETRLDNYGGNVYSVGDKVATIAVESGKTYSFAILNIPNNNYASHYWGKFAYLKNDYTVLEMFDFVKVGEVNGVAFTTFTVPVDAEYVSFNIARNFPNFNYVFNGIGKTFLVSEKILSPEMIVKKLKSINGFILEQNVDTSNVLTSKFWCAMGDSLTTTGYYCDEHYADKIASRNGMILQDLGKGSTGYMRKQESNDAFYQRISSMNTSCDYLTIFGSGNDIGVSGFPLGEASDVGTTTICGCINETIKNAILINPKIKIGIISPTPWGTTEYLPSNKNGKMFLYVEKMREICFLQGIPFLDLFHASGLRPWEQSAREAFYKRELEGGSIHPDDDGHEFISRKIESFLSGL